MTETITSMTANAANDTGLAATMTGWFEQIGIPPILIVFLISVLPVLELRGGLIAAAILHIDWSLAFPICLLGNVLPIPFILLFIKKIFEFMKRKGILKGLVERFEKKAESKSEDAKNKTRWGKIIFIFCFVAIPLPGTGGWTGALIASFMNMRLKDSIPAIVLGVLTAGIIMSVLTYLVPNLFGF